MRKVEEIYRCHTSLQKSKGAQFGGTDMSQAWVRRFLKKWERGKGRFKEGRKRQ